MAMPLVFTYSPHLHAGLAAVIITLVFTYNPHLHAGLAAFPSPADTAQGPSPRLSPQCSFPTNRSVAWPTGGFQ